MAKSQICSFSSMTVKSNLLEKVNNQYSANCQAAADRAESDESAEPQCTCFVRGRARLGTWLKIDIHGDIYREFDDSVLLG